VNTDDQPLFIFTIACPDRKGIVAAVSGFLADHDCFITESSHFGDPITQRFFMRTVFTPGPLTPPIAEATQQFSRIAERFQMVWGIHDARRKERLLVMVSRFDHCLNDLLYRYRTGDLRVEIPAIVSNHRDFYQLAATHDVPFHHLPMTEATKARQEARLLEIVAEERVDLVVLARYMQILSSDLARALHGRAINIHHSFLPSFKGAKPYHQAHRRGVKLIGATAHYVTADLDEGPIIEQDVARCDHAMTPDDLVAAGRDVECMVLARAVRWHAERRVLLNGGKTVVFR